jgi:hypothetical protein
MNMRQVMFLKQNIHNRADYLDYVPDFFFAFIFSHSVLLKFSKTPRA